MIALEVATLRGLLKVVGELETALEDAQGFAEASVSYEDDPEQRERIDGWAEAGEGEEAKRALAEARKALADAEDVEQHGPEPFDAYEIARVHELPGEWTGGGPVESVYERCDEPDCQHESEGAAIRTVWTLYGHVPGLGVEALSDFETREFATRTLSRIVGRHVTMEPNAISLTYRLER